MNKFRFFTLILLSVFYNSSIAQMGGFGPWEKLYSDGSIRVEVAFKINPCKGQESNNKSQYKYRVTGSSKSTINQYLNWKMDYIDCNGNLSYRNNALNIGSNNNHFRNYVSDFSIYPVDEDFTCKSLDKAYYDATLSYTQSKGGGKKSVSLRRATQQDLIDIWDGKYGVNPERKIKLMAAGIDPDDVQERINKGEGKPTLPSNQVTYLSVSNQNISFDKSGGIFVIDVKTNAASYQLEYLPSWCKVKNKYATSFSLTCDANTSGRRSDWFYIKAVDKTVKIDVSQSNGQPTNLSLSVSTENLEFSAMGDSKIIFVTTSARNYDISSLPKWCVVNAKNPSGFVLSCKANNKSKYRNDWFIVTAGDEKVKIYVNQEGKSNTTTPSTTKPKDIIGVKIGILSDTDDIGFQAGFVYEPLFKYGFGLRIGLLYENFSQYKNSGINLPIHLQYRLNFSSKFSLFGYSGLGFNLITKSGGYPLPTTLDYGFGIRIKNYNINLGFSNQINNNRVHEYGRILPIYKKVDLGLTINLNYDK